MNKRSRILKELKPGDKVLLGRKQPVTSGSYDRTILFTVVTSITEHWVVTRDSEAIFPRSQYDAEYDANKECVLWADPGEFFTRYWKFITKNSRTIKAWRLLGYLKKYLELEEEYEENME